MDVRGQPQPQRAAQGHRVGSQDRLGSGHGRSPLGPFHCPIHASPVHNITSPASVSPLLPVPQPCQALSTSGPHSHSALCQEDPSRSPGKCHLLHEALPDHQPLSSLLPHSPELSGVSALCAVVNRTKGLCRPPDSPPAGRSSAAPGPGRPAAAGTGTPAAAESAAGRRAAAAGRGAGSCGPAGTGRARAAARRPAPSAPLGGHGQ